MQRTSADGSEGYNGGAEAIMPCPSERPVHVVRHGRLAGGLGTFPGGGDQKLDETDARPQDGRHTANGALDSVFRNVTDPRVCRSRADGTYISTDNRTSLPSGPTLSKAALLRVRLLHLGGWIGFGFFVWALRSREVGPVPAALGAVIWLLGGVAITLGLRGVYRRARSADWSFTSLVVL